MSNKSGKKSDQSKKWMRTRKNRNFVQNPDHHLIVSEGTKTEPNYFEGLAANINSGVSFEKRQFIRFHIEGSGRNTVGVFEEAVHRAEEIEKSESIKLKKVWVVYDKDDFSDEDFNKVSELCKNASDETRQFHALWSNQCIELWFLLHFEYIGSAISRDDYLKKLNEHLGDKGYAKNSTDMFDILLPRLKDAMKNSKRLLQEYPEDMPPAQKEPATVIHELFEALGPHINWET